MRSTILKGLVLAAACAAGLAPAAAQVPPTRIQSLSARPDTDQQRKEDLVLANHILANEGVLDGLGHISVRSKSNPKHFFMSRSRSAGSVAVGDVMEFDENSQPVDRQGREIFGERFIHGEIYRARPDVQAVVHSHSSAILPFAIADVPFRAAIHMAAFIGVDPVPVFEIRDSVDQAAAAKTHPQAVMNVDDNKVGAALARTLGDRSMVIMRGHGMVVVADEYPGGPARWVADRAYYVHENARVLAAGLQLGKLKPLNLYEARFVAGSLPRWWEEYSARAEANYSRKH